MKATIRAYWQSLVSVIGVFVLRSTCLAQAPAYTDGELTTKDHLFFMVTSGFGALLIVFFGLGGFATLMITRQGKAGKNAPIFGIAMLLVAGFIFCYRVLIKSGFLGQEYLEF